MQLVELFIREALMVRFNCKSNIVGMYQYGSRLYGTNDEDSDWDFVVVVDELDVPYAQYETEDFDIHLLSAKHYKNLLLEHDIMALECFYQKDPIMRFEVEFHISLPLLRKSISSVVNNSWVKAKKKMELPEEDSYIGLKSLLHSFRILDFGIQIAVMNNIHYSSANGLWIEMKDFWVGTHDWDFYYGEYKQQHNELMTQFRKVAPKEIKNG